MAFRTPFQPLPMEDNPRKVFYQLFGQGDTDDERKRDPQRDRQHARLRAGEGATPQASASAQPTRRASPTTWTRCARSSGACRSWRPARACSMNLPNAPLGIPDEFGEHLECMFEHDRAGLAVQPDARGLVHDGEGSQHAHLQPDRRVRCLPSAVASPERSGRRSSGW